MQMFIVSLQINSPIWKQPKCPLKDEWTVFHSHSKILLSNKCKVQIHFQHGLHHKCIIHNDRRHILNVQIMCYFTYSIGIQQLTSTSPYFVLVSLSYILFLHMFTYLLCKYVGMIWLSNNSLEGKKIQFDFLQSIWT